MRIKKSKRGLTFSFQENESFYAGARYRYVVDRELDEVIIIPDKDGKYQMSRKGVTHKPLVDLRNHEIREIIALAWYMEVEIQEDKIVVHVIKSQVHTESLSDRELLSMLDEKENLTFEISKEDLLTKDEALMDMLRCAGLFSTKEKSDLQYVFDVVSLFSGAGLLDYPFAKDDSFDIKFALAFYLKNDTDFEHRKTIIYDVSSITHAHIISKIACHFLTEFAIALLSGFAVDIAYEETRKTFTDYYKDTAEAECFTRIFSGELLNATINNVKSSGYVVDTLESAIWCIFHTDS